MWKSCLRHVMSHFIGNNLKEKKIHANWLCRQKECFIFKSPVSRSSRHLDPGGGWESRFLGQDPGVLIDDLERGLGICISGMFPGSADATALEITSADPQVLDL